MSRFISRLTLAALLIFATLAPGVAQARGRNTYTPFVMTPNGPMLRSQYLMQTMQFVNPQLIAAMQQQEQQYLNKNKKPAANTGAKNTAGKTTTTKKK